MRTGVFPLIAAIIFCGMAGCSHTQAYLDIARDRGISEEYLKVQETWTRGKIVYSQFETMAHISATYRSPDFNRAYRKEFAKVYHLRAGEIWAREEVSDLMTADFTEFVCYAYTPDKAANDFDRRGSVWSIFLLKENGERVDPLEVRKIEPITPVINTFFPYINPYYGFTYRLRFPLLVKEGESNGRFKLVFASVIGEVALDFGTR